MSDSLFSAWGFSGSGPAVVLREFVQWLVRTMGPLIEVLKPMWDRMVAFLGKLYEQLSEQYKQDQDRASWGRQELGWES